VGAILENWPAIAMGVAEHPEYLGLFFFSPDVNWRQLTREIAAKTAFDLMDGLWQRIPVLMAKVDGPIYDCGSIEGYRRACEDGRLGKLW
jgi:UTP-glucose-1-phosphate uridylyltransferase